MLNLSKIFWPLAPPQGMTQGQLQQWAEGLGLGK